MVLAHYGYCGHHSHSKLFCLAFSLSVNCHHNTLLPSTYLYIYAGPRLMHSFVGINVDWVARSNIFLLVFSDIATYIYIIINNYYILAD